MLRSLRPLARCVLATAVAALALGGRAEAQSTYTWANSNITATPPSLLDWFTGGPNTQGTWQGGDPVSGSANTIQFFENTTTALTNTVAATQTVNLNNGGSAFQLGTLTLSGLASETTNADLTMNLSGDALNFSGATGTINLNALNNTRTITYNVNNAIRLGTAGSGSVLTIGGTGTGNFVIGGVISELQAGGGSLIKNGASAVSLAGANSYTGGTTLNAGRLNLNSASAIGTGPLVIAGGTLGNTSGAAITLSTNNAQTWSGNFTFAGTSDLNLGTGAVALGGSRIVTVSANTLTVGGVISGTGGLTKAGAGTLSLDGANTYAGTTSVSAGRLNINSATAIGTGTLTMSAGITLGNTSGGAITLSTNNALNFNTSVTFAGPYDLNLGTGAVPFGSSGRTFTVLAGTLAIDGVISSVATLTKAGAGTLSLGGANTRTGATTVNGGTLVLNYGTQDNSKLSDTASLTLGGGAVVLKGGSHAEIVLSTTMSTGASRISRDGGSSVLQLNAITRSTDVKGSLAFGAGSIATTDTLNTNGILGGWATIGNDWAINSTNAADGAITALASYDGALPTATGTSTANYTLTGNQTQTGAVAANTVKITNTGNSETLNLGGNNLTITAASSQTAGGIMYAGGADGNYTIDSTGGKIMASASREVIFQIMSGTLTVNAAVGAGVGNPYYTKYGAGTLVVGASNNFTATIEVIEGVLRFTNAQAQGQATNRNIVRVGAALELANDISVAAKPLDLFGSGISNAGALRNFSGTNTYAGAITIGSGGASITSDAGGLLTLSGGVVTASGNNATFGGAGDITIGSAISGAGEVLKEGAGALTLSVGNGQANTTVNAGQLNVNHIAALGTPAGTLTMAASTSLDNTSGSAVAVSNPKSIALGNSLTFVGSNDLNLGGGTTTLSATTTFDIQAGELTLGGDVVGAGFGIIKNGTGTLALGGLTGANSFTGNSTINAGTLLLEGSSILGGGSSTVVTLGANGFLEVGASASLGNVTIAGFTQNLITNTPVNANQDFTVSQTLTTANAKYNGVQTLFNGATVTTTHNYLGTIPTSATAGRIVFQNGSTLAATEDFEIAPNQGVSLDAGTATVSVAAGKRVFLESAVAGSGGLRKTGAGNLRLTGTNTYQGGTLIEQGILGISSGAALGDVAGGLTIDGATLAAATNPDGSGSGATIDAARTVLIGNGKTSGLHAQTGLTLRYDGAIAEIDSQGAAGSLQFGFDAVREGTVILGGANTYRGDTILSHGTLKLGSGGSFANSARIIVGDAASNGAVFDLTDKTAFSIGSAQTLMGKGTVVLGANTALTIKGVFSLGISPGLFTYDGGSTTLSGTTLMEIWGTTRGVNPGYDAVNVINSGLLTLGGTLELNFDQNFLGTDSFLLFDTLTSGSLAGGFTGITITGSNNAYVGLSFTQAGNVWTTGYNGNNQGLRLTQTASNVTLDVIVVPEPAALALLASASAAGWVGWRRRQTRRGTAGHGNA